VAQKRKRAVRDVRALGAHALSLGAVVVDPTRMTWDVSGDCLSSRYVELWGRAEHRPAKLTASDFSEFEAILANAWRDNGTFTVEMETRCRKCAACLQARAYAWTQRAKSELNAASRTWFGTITLRAEEQFRMELLAWKRLAEGGTNYDRLPPSEQFVERHREIGAELTKWLKRIRKESGAPLRYILVAEAHKSGLPHYHVLVHECDPMVFVGERTLRKQWKLGFSKFNLVNADEPAAYYVCKYLSKAALARVRASQGYGKTLSVKVSKTTVKRITF
jgi:hypothetical protein